MIVDLLPDGSTALSQRRDSIRPRNAKRNDVQRILDTAARNAAELKELWEKTHG